MLIGSLCLASSKAGANDKNSLEDQKAYYPDSPLVLNADWSLFLAGIEAKPMRRTASQAIYPDPPPLVLNAVSLGIWREPMISTYSLDD
jgi:hypothetical protein